MILNFNRAMRARVHAALLDVMPGENPTVEQAFCEIVAWNDTDGIDDLTTVLDLSAKIDYHVYREIHRSDFEYAEVDASALGELYTAATIRLAMKLAGYGTRVSAQDMRWTDAPGNEPTVKVTLSQEDFGDG